MLLQLGEFEIDLEDVGHEAELCCFREWRGVYELLLATLPSLQGKKPSSDAHIGKRCEANRTAVIELVDRLKQTQHALLDQVISFISGARKVPGPRLDQGAVPVQQHFQGIALAPFGATKQLMLDLQKGTHTGPE